jgi:hypothetical protein
MALLLNSIAHIYRRVPILREEELFWEIPVEILASQETVGSKGIQNYLDLFRIRCGLAVLSEKIYKQLYSVKGLEQSTDKRFEAIKLLHADLEALRNTFPADCKPWHEIKIQDELLRVEFAVTHFFFFGCMIAIHQIAVRYGIQVSLDTFTVDAPGHPSISHGIPPVSSFSLYLTLARASIELLKHIPEQEFGIVW